MTHGDNSSQEEMHPNQPTNNVNKTMLCQFDKQKIIYIHVNKVIDDGKNNK